MVYGQSSSLNGAPKFAPIDGERLLIVGQDLGSVGGLNSYANGYIDGIGHMPAGVTTYVGLPSMSGLTQTANWGAGDVNASQYTEDADFDQTTIAIGFHIVNELKNIINGVHDTKLVVLAQWIKDSDRPVFFRIGYEFDGSWNNYSTTDFKAAWIYIVKLFDEQDVRNVAYVWQSAGINTSNISRWYPGDEYVNWVGYSHFDGPNPGQSIRDFAVDHNKPIMIAEATPRRDINDGNPSSHWNTWFEPLFESVYENDQIKALAYINADWDNQSMWTGQGWGDSRVEIDAEITSSWMNEISKEDWLLSNDQLFDQLDYDAWVDSVVLILAVEKKVITTNLVIRRSGEVISLHVNNGDLMDQVEIWGLDGKKLFLSIGVSNRVDFGAHLVEDRLVIVRVSNSKGVMVKKVIITNR